MTDNNENFARFGVYHTTGGRVLRNSNRKYSGRLNSNLSSTYLRALAGLEDESMDSPAAAIDPVRNVISGARSYAHSRGLADPHAGIDYHKVNTNRTLLSDLAHHYNQLPHNDPSAHKHFAAMRDDVRDQYEHLTNRMGIKVSVQDHDPYKDVHALRQDVQNNHRIQILGTHKTGSHPFFSDEDNDKFRAVHDVFGHLGTGRDFDRHGEEAAYQAHARMFSDHARPALATETRGQNGHLIVHGNFADQRIAVLPHRLWHPGLATTSKSGLYEGVYGFTAVNLMKASEVIDTNKVGTKTYSGKAPMERIAVLVDSADDNAPLGMQVIAHVSGNSVNVLHCCFCGSGAVIGRSDGTIECGYCTSVFTVQVQPEYNAFPQSVDGQQYPWPGQPGPGDTLDPTVPPGTNMAPGVQPPPGTDPSALGGQPGAFTGPPGAGGPLGGPPDSSDPADGGPPEEGDEEDSGNPFAKSKGKDDKSKGKDDKGKGDDKKKGKNPFAKKKSYLIDNGNSLDEEAYIAHLAIKFADNPQEAIRKVRSSWADNPEAIYRNRVRNSWNETTNS